MIAWAIETLLASSVLMLLVLAIRAPVRRQFGADAAYALWLLPVARLALPPLPGAWQWSRLFAPLVAGADEVGMVAGVMPPAAVPTEAAGSTIIIAIGTTGASVPVPLPVALVPPTLLPQGGAPLLALLGGLWLLGAAAFILFQLTRYIRFCRRLRQSGRISAIGPVGVIHSPAVPGPLAFGIWRKYVAFPLDFSERYDTDEQALALAHELTHHARGDLIANWVALVVLAIHWFNPVAWRAFRAFRADQEMACDARVLAERDPALRHAYGRAIVKSAYGAAISPACHLHTINDLKGRLKMLSHGTTSPRRVAGGAASVAAIALAGLVLTASGGQAAERLRATVNETIGVDLARLDSSAPRTALIDPTPVAPTAPDAPAKASTAPEPPLPPVPPKAPAPGTAANPPAPPLPPVPPHADARDVDDAVDVSIVDLTRDRAASSRPRHGDRGEIIWLGRKSGAAADDGDHDLRSGTALGGCRGDGGPTVFKADGPGRRMVIICRDRVEKLARDSVDLAMNSKDIERRAYRSALIGLRGARAKMAARGNADATKAIDKAIAEVEEDLAKVN